MTHELDQKVLAKLAKVLALTCFRKTKLAEFRTGIVPTSLTGDSSDILVRDAKGNVVPWPEVCLLDDESMQQLMAQFYQRIYGLLARVNAVEHTFLAPMAGREPNPERARTLEAEVGALAGLLDALYDVPEVAEEATNDGRELVFELLEHQLRAQLEVQLVEQLGDDSGNDSFHEKLLNVLSEKNDEIMLLKQRIHSLEIEAENRARASAELREEGARAAD